MGNAATPLKIKLWQLRKKVFRRGSFLNTASQIRKATFIKKKKKQKTHLDFDTFSGFGGI